MDEQQNGQEKKPAISIWWDEKTQTPYFNVDEEQLRSRGMVICVLDQCKGVVETAQRMERLAAMQQQAMLLGQEQQIRSKLGL